MLFYALSTVPLIRRLSSADQVWYADDATASGSIAEVKSWWDDLNRLGPGFGYYVNAAKTWLVVKKQCHAAAISAFSGNG